MFLTKTNRVSLSVRFLDKTGYTGSTFQLINGVFLLSTFFLVRIVYGWYTVSLPLLHPARPLTITVLIVNIILADNVQDIGWNAHALLGSVHDRTHSLDVA